MKIRVLAAASAVLCAAGLAPRLSAAKVTADLAPPQRRETSVTVAEQLTQRPAPAPLPAELPSPFNPESFNQPDPDAPGAPAAGAAGRPGTATNTATTAQPARPAGDREILETLAMRLTPSGMIALGGKPFLIIDRNRFEIGTKFIVTYSEQDYELELVTIDRTTFTLRYRGEEITRPIKSAK